MNRSLLALPLASLLVALPGCDWLGQRLGERAPAGAGSASAGTSAAATPGLPASFAAMKVPSGAAPDGAWLPAYAVGRAAGSDGLTFERAAGACRERGQELCTETQWTRACEVHEALGTVASYTLGAARPGAVVVRGAGGCAARAEVPVSAVDPARAALCCTRAVAVTSANADESFRAASAERLLAYERAVRARDAGALGAVLGERVICDGRDLDRGEAQAALAAGAAAGAPILDRCEVTLDRSGPEPLLVSDCRVLAAGTPGPTSLRIVHGGPDLKILLVGTPESMPLLDRGKKQRATELIGGD